ncbi:MAG: DUF72 domain-containing protein [Chloroflexota bacterium]|nr:DUF72 domain-containing protein [Chloroflexota bacterium]
MAKILIGTCSWTDPTLINSGRFYPPSVQSVEARLQFYAQNFPIVEVDSSYYALPSENNAKLWAERTPSDFTFDIKAFSLFTQHPAQARSLPKDIVEGLSPEARQKSNIYYRDVSSDTLEEIWKRFAEALLPLDSAGKLGVVLFQFPQWFFPSRANKDYILSAKEKLPQYRLAIEFRSASWLNERNIEYTFAFLKDNDLAFVCVDEPQGFKSSVPPVAEATSSLALVRFHGRNRETWEKKGISAAERFDYLYSEEELAEWVPKIKGLAAQTEEVHVLMNNCYQDKAVVNGRQIRLMLE